MKRRACNERGEECNLKEIPNGDDENNLGWMAAARLNEDKCEDDRRGAQEPEQRDAKRQPRKLYDRQHAILFNDQSVTSSIWSSAYMVAFMRARISCEVTPHADTQTHRHIDTDTGTHRFFF